MKILRCDNCRNKTPTDGVFCLLCGSLRKKRKGIVINTGSRPTGPSGQLAWERAKGSSR